MLHSFGNQGVRVGKKSAESMIFEVQWKLVQSLMIWDDMSSAGVGGG